MSDSNSNKNTAQAPGLLVETPALVEEEEDMQEDDDTTHSLLFYKEWLEGQISALSPAAATDYYHAELVRLEVNDVGDARYVKHLQRKIEHTSAAARAIQAAFGEETGEPTPVMMEDDSDDEELQFGNDGIPVVDMVPTPFSLSPAGCPAEPADGGDTSSLAYYKDWVEQTTGDLENCQDILAFYKSEHDRLLKETTVDMDGRYKTFINGLIKVWRDAQTLKEVKEQAAAARTPEVSKVSKDTAPTKASFGKKLCRELLLLCCPFGANRKESQKQTEEDAGSLKSETTEDEEGVEE